MVGVRFLLLILALLLSIATASFVGQLVLLANQSQYYCNDGTQSGFYFQKAANASLVNRYMIFFEGGAWCWDEASCNERYQSSIDLMSSKNWGPTLTRTDGIFVSSPWANANIIYVMYCSSDGWVGNRTKSPDTYNWYFNGKNIVTGVVLELLSNYNMKQATEILITGCSAGGRSAIQNLDYLTDLIRQQVSSSAVIKGFFDSAWWLEGYPLYPGTSSVTLVDQARQSYALSGAIPNAGCASTFGTQDQWQCNFGSNIWPHIRTPHSYALFEFDEWQLTTDSNGVFPWENSPAMNADMTYYALQFANVTRYTLVPLIQSSRSVFASACYSHCSTESSNWYNVKIQGQSLDQAVNNWFFQGTPFQLVDTCQSWKCGVGCPN